MRRRPLAACTDAQALADLVTEIRRTVGRTASRKATPRVGVNGPMRLGEGYVRMVDGQLTWEGPGGQRRRLRAPAAVTDEEE